MVDFAQYRGLVLLVTNVASRCDFTDQHYRLYNRWYKEYHYQGFEILAFPCNQFKNQEPGTDEEVKKFCEENYGVTYPLFSKVSNAADQPLHGAMPRYALGFAMLSALL